MLNMEVLWYASGMQMGLVWKNRAVITEWYKSAFSIQMGLVWKNRAVITEWYKSQMEKKESVKDHLRVSCQVENQHSATGHVFKKYHARQQDFQALTH
jgi:hypothetical protein